MFLTIVTRHMVTRPGMFAKCVDSLKAQTCQDFEHLVLVDDVGRGVPWANAQLPKCAGVINGDYVLILDDDDALATPDAIAVLQATVKAEAPDMVVFRGRHGHHGILPDALVWQRRPVQSHISGQDFILRREMWQRHVPAFAQPSCGDYHMLAALWDCGYRIYWLDRVLVNAGHNFGAAE